MKQPISRFFSIVWCSKRMLRIVALVVGLFWFGGEASGQTLKVILADTVGMNLEDETPKTAVRNVLCLDDLTHYPTYKINILVEVPSAMSSNNYSWGDADVIWTFPNKTGFTWTAKKVDKTDAKYASYDNYDLIELTVPNNPASTDEYGLLKGGDFKAEYPSSDASGSILATANIHLPLRPPVSASDTIIMDSVLCQGEILTFKILNKGSTTETGEYWDEINPDMFFGWTVLDTDGKPIQITESKDIPNTDTTFDLNGLLLSGNTADYGYNPKKHGGVVVQRFYCKPNYNTRSAGGSEFLAPAKIQKFDDKIKVANPPVDTVDKSKYVINRIFWGTTSGAFIEGTGPADTLGWQIVSGDDIPLCVNYDAALQSIEEDGVQVGNTTGGTRSSAFNFTYSQEGYAKQAAQGFVFLQVGDESDSLIDYKWEIVDNEGKYLAERVFPNGSDPTFSDDGRSINPARWTPVDGYGLNGGFGVMMDDGNKLNRSNSPYSWRAAFRVLPFPEGDRPAGDLVIRVTAKCMLCEKDGIPFDNEPILINLGKPWDTTKPVDEGFEIGRVDAEFSTQALSDTFCAATPVWLRMNKTLDINTLSYFDTDELKEKYNIEYFVAKGLHQVGGVVRQDWFSGQFNHSYDKDEFNGSGYYGEFTFSPGASQTVQSAPYGIRVSGANACFTRKLIGDIRIDTVIKGATVEENVYRDSIYFNNPQTDSVWFGLHTIRLEKLPAPPRVYDSLGGGYIDGGQYDVVESKWVGIDTVRLCEYELLDSLGRKTGRTGYRLELFNIDDRLINDDGTHGGSGAHRWKVIVNGSTPGGEGSGHPIGINNEVRTTGNNPVFINFDDAGYGHQSYVNLKIDTNYLRPDSTNFRRSGLLMWQAHNACGWGDSVVIAYETMDTVPFEEYTPTVWADVDPATPMKDYLTDTRICEGEELSFLTSYNMPEGYTMTEKSVLSNKQARVFWQVDSTWTVGVRNRDLEDGLNRYTSIRFGKDSGIVAVRFVNQCGSSMPVESSMVYPVNYYRAQWDTISDTVCADSVYTYALKSMNKLTGTEDEMGDLMMTFPNDWWIASRMWDEQEPVEGPYYDTFSKVLIGDPAPTYESVYYRAQVGHPDSLNLKGGERNILVRWIHMYCDIQHNRPEYWDTTKVFVRTHPLIPVVDVWPKDTVCARDTFWYSVKPTKEDSIQDNFYVWTFPAGWEVVDSSGARGGHEISSCDSVRVVTSGTFGAEDTIRVTAQSWCCGQPIGEAMKKAVWIWDTATFDPEYVRDAYQNDEPFGTRPCGGDTLQLFVNRPFDVDTIKWWWQQPGIVPTDSLVDSVKGNMNMGSEAIAQYKFADTLCLPDTLAFHSVKSLTFTPLIIRMDMQNRCGWSHSPEIEITPVDELTESFAPKFETSTPVVLCQDEDSVFKLTYQDSPLKNAGQYVWYFAQEGRELDSVVEQVIEGNLGYEHIFKLMPADTGRVWVVAKNTCSRTLESDTVTITKVKRFSNAPMPMDFGFFTSAANYVDTVCLYSDKDWMIKADTVDEREGLSLQPFIWMRLSGDTLPTFGDLLDTSAALSVNHDKVQVKGLAMDAKRQETLIGVTARQEGCVENGDTLLIRLISVDTLSLNVIDSVTFELLDVEDYQILPCEGIGEIRVKAWHDTTILGFRWELPTGYEFVSGKDSMGESVDVRVGTTPGKIGVRTMTGRNYDLSKNYCTYENQSAVYIKEAIQFWQPPVLDSFVLVSDTACPETDFGPLTVYAHDSDTLHVDAYKFIVAHILDDESDTVFLFDTVIATKRDTFEYTIPGDSLRDSTWRYLISAVAIDSTCGACTSDSITHEFAVISLPRITNVIVDAQPCPDSVIKYIFVSNHNLASFDMAEGVVSGGVSVNNIIEDSVWIEFNSNVGDSIELLFDMSYIFDYCNNEMETEILHRYDTTLTLKSDTLMNFDINVDRFYPNVFHADAMEGRACTDDTVILVASIIGESSFAVRFGWDVPDDWSDTILGRNADTLIARTANVAGEYTVVVSASGGCGTSREPKEFPITVEAAPDYEEILVHASDTTACEESELIVWVDTTGTGLIVDQFRWSMDGADFDTIINSITDTAKITVPKGEFTVRASYYVTGDVCFTKRDSTIVYIETQDLPAKPTPIQNLYPCPEEPFELSLNYDEWTDSIAWKRIGTVSEYDSAASKIAQDNGKSIYDSLYFENVGTAPFKLRVEAHNACNFRYDTFTISPEKNIEPFKEELTGLTTFDNLRYCFNDTIWGDVRIPAQHVTLGLTHHIELPSDWIRVEKKDSIIVVGADTVKRFYFIPGQESGMIKVWTEGCGDKDSVETNVDVQPTRLYLEFSKSNETSSYGDETMLFIIDSAGIINSSGEREANHWEDFDYSWSDRFESTNPANTIMRLKWVYLKEESFVVKAIEKSTLYPGQFQCTTTDTIELIADGTYSSKVDFEPAVCKDVEFELTATHQGGEAEFYRQEWFIYNPMTGKYEPKPEVEGTILRHIVRFDTDDTLYLDDTDTLRFRFVGYDSLYSNEPVADPRTTALFSDTTNIAIRIAPSILAEISGMDLAKITDQLYVLKSLELGDSVMIGDRLLFHGRVWRDYDSASAIAHTYRWLTPREVYPEDQHTYPYAGYTEAGEFRPDTANAVTGVIFYPQWFYYRVEDPSAYGCVSTVGIEIKLRTEAKDVFGQTVPGGFSPWTSDGVNDVFMKDVDEITIMNRWGVVVYESKERRGWDGRNTQSNRLVDRGDYFYILTVVINNIRYTKTGVVTVF
ncbi:MAG: gliding motility-associated C-terminal domain-containing protein [Bacteroidales bacterium]|nr:gliding motility-associated C-terminal domain-containing protein [Bacteroidales bacterium]